MVGNSDVRVGIAVEGITSDYYDKALSSLGGDTKENMDLIKGYKALNFIAEDLREHLSQLREVSRDTELKNKDTVIDNIQKDVLRRSIELRDSMYDIKGTMSPEDFKKFEKEFLEHYNLTRREDGLGFEFGKNGPTRNWYMPDPEKLLASSETAENRIVLSREFLHANNGLRSNGLEVGGPDVLSPFRLSREVEHAGNGPLGDQRNLPSENANRPFSVAIKNGM